MLINYQVASKNKQIPRFAVAPMLDWTDRHCRFFYRCFTKHALVYTEMIVADAICHGPRDSLLSFSDCEHPISLQLGGSSPDILVEAARIASDYGYDEINLNVGCPSDRVLSGVFGASLMYQPKKVAQIIEKLKKNISIPITIKCRIGVDEQPIPDALFKMVTYASNEGVDAIWVHARKAWLKGLSPKENRRIPPLNYNVVYELKENYPDLFIGINGGIASIQEIKNHLDFVDGVMLGRAVYYSPSLLHEIDTSIYSDISKKPIYYDHIISTMIKYAEIHIKSGGKLHQITRHMHGLFRGHKGAKHWRRLLSEKGNSVNVLQMAYEQLLIKSSKDI